MKRSPLEMSEQFRKVVESQSEDDIAAFLEDINDSIVDINMNDYVARSEYDQAVAERDKAVAGMNDYRDRYINRFSNPGNTTNDITIIQGGAPQLEIEKTEEEFSYRNLFE